MKNKSGNGLGRARKKNAQIFSVDVMIALIVFIFIILTISWFWDSTKEKISLTEERNDLERAARDAISVMVNTVGDPPNWHKLEFNEANVDSIGIGKNRAWIIDEDKAKRLGEQAQYYETVKRILGIRGPNYEMFLNISEYDSNEATMIPIAIIGIEPNETAKNVVRINRIAQSDANSRWVSITMFVWQSCEGSTCY